ncbi:hypothetical protein AVEN_260755-1 [Araneus ventricosus]|uniref:Uncharacterized protein n=1 Tax=Araneus ventricosus TaxID=182803 RepID=A0A4Y1ZSK9_ARAVE|nr:hypothetical protein AVEN_41346-1 [Araneus ventricosus]GBL65816.1 hypothetical protein AVEN_208789-1 [Araneus ventricosus]GBN94785.1 hypothetical protein AVEN_260755-1 [Araneus ventricosus]
MRGNWSFHRCCAHGAILRFVLIGLFRSYASCDWSIQSNLFCRFDFHMILSFRYVRFEELLLIMAPNPGNIGSLSTYHQLQIEEAKVVFQWCVDQGLIASGYQCPKCKQQLGN